MHVCVLSSVTGEPRHLLYDTEKECYAWVDKSPEDAWVLGDKNAELSIDQLCKISGRGIDVIPDKKRAQVLKLLQTTDKDLRLRWRYSMPSTEFKTYIKRLIDDCLTVISEGNSDYYIDVFRRTTRCLRSLETAHIDADRLYSYYATEKNESNRTTLKTFFPGKDGFTSPVEYHQASTVTGRLTIASGPRILTLRKEYRDCIKSRYDGGKVVVLDFMSLEPRIALADAGRPIPFDVYGDINTTLFGESIDRDRIKIMSIALLYGAQEDTFRKVSGMAGTEMSDAMDRIGSYFGIRASRARLLRQFKAKNYITNCYGRIIKPARSIPRLLYNYFVQSSAVDVALLGFDNVIQLIKQQDWKINPLFIIHDALMLDVHPDFMQYIDRIRECFKVDGFEDLFPVKCEEITHG